MAVLLRHAVLAAAGLSLAVGLTWASGAGADQSSADDLGRALQLDDVVAVLFEEGLAHGRDLDRDMLDGAGGDWWARQVADIYDPDRMKAVLVTAFADGMSPEHIAESVAFFDTPVGQNILSLETSARKAIADPAIEDIARATYDHLKGGDDPRFGAVARYVAINDLVERNVAGTMSSLFQFYRGLADGGALEIGEAEILADIWADEVETRADTESWLFGFLLMAYRPLPTADMEAYNSYSETPAGKAMNAALFAGFDVLYRDISYALGRSLARAMEASDL